MNNFNNMGMGMNNTNMNAGMNNYNTNMGVFGQTGMNSYMSSTNVNNLPRYSIIKVHGYNGADAFQMGPNSQVFLLDDNDPLIWFVQTDGAGYKTITPYDVAPHQTAPQVDVQSLEARVRTLEEQISNVKSYSGPNKSNNTKKQQQQRNDYVDAANPEA